MKTALAALAFVFLSGAFAFAGAVRPVVVEVYTSQGCNSCLFANTMAGKIAQKPDVLLLSFGVTYWDMFGWKDTLANEDNTKRQKAYAAALHRGGVYTPQMIIDGARDVPASRADAVGYALEMAAMRRDDGYQPDVETPAALARKDGRPIAVVAGARVKTLMPAAWSVGVNLTRGPDGLHVAVARAQERHGVDATVWLLRVRSHASVKITAGESAGQTVTYRNAVTGIQNLGNWRGEAQVFSVPKPAGSIAAHDSVAVLVQQGGYGRIVGATLSRGSAY
jgi:hypothetical protein